VRVAPSTVELSYAQGEILADAARGTIACASSITSACEQRIGGQQRRRTKGGEGTLVEHFASGRLAQPTIGLECMRVGEVACVAAARVGWGKRSRRCVSASNKAWL
jgi:hypothetical protein